MVRLASLLLLAALATASASAKPRTAALDLTPPAATADAAAWSAFSTNLVRALQSDNLGLKTSALQHVATYGPRLDVRAARFDIVRLYRDHRDRRVRVLALAAIVQTRYGWSLDFVRRCGRGDADAQVARLSRAASQAAVL